VPLGAEVLETHVRPEPSLRRGNRGCVSEGGEPRRSTDSRHLLAAFLPQTQLLVLDQPSLQAAADFGRLGNSRSRPDRRLLLGASIRVLQDRFVHGRPICRDDIVRVAALADDAQGAGP
jgi:hypothetical protein